MAVQADFFRFLGAHHEILRLVGVVAAVAGQVLLLVGAAGPQGVFTGVVAALAAGAAHLGV
jgi:hypothetical protein